MLIFNYIKRRQSRLCVSSFKIFKMHVTKNLFPLILAVLMMTVQQGQSRPVKPYEDLYLKQLNEMLIYVSKNVNRTNVLDFTMGAFYTVDHITKQFILDNVEELLQDPAIVNVKTDKMEEYKLKLNEMLEYYKKSTKITVPLHGFRYYLTSIGLNVNAKDVSGEEELLINELKERILDPMDIRTKENHSKTLDALEKVVEQYLTSLSEEERKGEEDMEQWLKQFKKADTMEKKAELIAQFVKFF